MTVPVILLPPSEGKATGGRGAWEPASGRFAALAEARVLVAGALAAAVDGPPDAVAKLLGVSGPHLDHAIQADRRVLGAPALPASARYTGVVHAHLDLGGLPAAARRRAANVVVLSGLAGAVGPTDPLPDYRLKMGASLAPLGKLSTWWRPLLADALDPVCTDRVVADLLPHEHAAAYEPARVARRHIRARFERITRVGRRWERTVVGHDAKAAKGLLARHLLTAAGGALDRFESFEADGWHLDPDSTWDRRAPRGTTTTVTYIRPGP